MHSASIDGGGDASMKRRIEIFQAESSRASHARDATLFPSCEIDARHARARIYSRLHCMAYTSERHGSTNLSPEKANFLRKLDSRRCFPPDVSRSSAEDFDDNFKYLKICAFHLVGFHSILGCLSAPRSHSLLQPFPCFRESRQERGFC